MNDLVDDFDRMVWGLKDDLRTYSYLAISTFDVTAYDHFNALCNDRRFRLERLGITDFLDNRDETPPSHYGCNARRRLAMA